MTLKWLNIFILLSVFVAVAQSKDSSDSSSDSDSSSSDSDENSDEYKSPRWIKLLKKVKIHDRHKKWIPKSSRRTREEWESKHGTTSDIVYEGLLSLVRMCKKLILLKNNTQVTDKEIQQFDIFLFGTLPTLKQARECILEYDGEEKDIEKIMEKINDNYREEIKIKNKNKKYGRKRKNRKNKGKFGNAKDWKKKKNRNKRSMNNIINLWKLPIVYKYGGGHNSQDQLMIDAALASWEKDTCIRFREASNNETVDHQHIILTASSRCYSHLGMTPIHENFPQQLNLQSRACTSNVGIPIHEIGHSLGLIHEHSRRDRDRHIFVYYGAIPIWFRGRFAKSYESPELRSSSYDFNSIMHYGPMAYRLSEKYNTIYTRNPNLRTNIGQRSKLSFIDIKRVNKAYCSGTCDNRQDVAYCANGGYPNPNDCTLCNCPEGLTGYGCLNAKVESTGGCSRQGTVYTSTDGSEQCITSRNRGLSYNKGDYCGLKFRTLDGQRIRFRFVGGFGIYMSSYVCQHWLEIKFGPNYALPGARYCGRRRPYSNTGYFDTPTDEMFVNFNAKYPSVTNKYTRTIPPKSMVGFKMCYRMIPGPKTTTRTTMSTTKSTTMSTTKLTTKSTTKSTTTTPTKSTTTTPVTSTTTTPATSEADITDSTLTMTTAPSN